MEKLRKKASRAFGKEKNVGGGEVKAGSFQNKHPEGLKKKASLFGLRKSAEHSASPPPPPTVPKIPEAFNQAKHLPLIPPKERAPQSTPPPRPRGRQPQRQCQPAVVVKAVMPPPPDVPQPVPWPGQSPDTSPVRPPKKFVRKEPQTFGVSDEYWRQKYEDHPMKKRWKLISAGKSEIKPGDVMLFPPGIPSPDFMKYKSLYKDTGSPFENGSPEADIARSFLKSSGPSTAVTTAPTSHHENDVLRSAPLVPPPPFLAREASASSSKSLRSKSATNSPTHQEFSPLASASPVSPAPSPLTPESKEGTFGISDYPSQKTSFLGRSDARKIKSKRSLRDLFKRPNSSGSATGEMPQPIAVPVPGLFDVPPLPTKDLIQALTHPTDVTTHPALLPVHPALRPVPPILTPVHPALRSTIPVIAPPLSPARPAFPGAPFKKRAGPPPPRPPRPHDHVDLDLVAMRGASLRTTSPETEVPKPPPGLTMGMKGPNGELLERASRERYTVERQDNGTVIHDFVLDKDMFVPDI